ncbi:MAG: DUF349 domain-containing protein [Bacteroidales bacterium]|nr:DUF349 domain-containing protein [Bacteroidales bacterium]
MTEIDPKDSVQKEQFGNAENTNASAVKNDSEKESSNIEEENVTQEAPSSEPSAESSNKTPDETPESVNTPTPPSVEENSSSEKTEAEPAKTTEPEPVTSNTEPQTENATENTPGSQEPIVDNNPGVKNDTAEAKTDPAEPKEEAVVAETTSEVATDEKSSNTEEDKKEEGEEEKIDFTKLDQEQLVNMLEILIQTKDINVIKNDIEIIKALFYKNIRTELDLKKEKFLASGGIIEDFKPEVSPLENKVKDLLILYRDKRNDINQQQEVEKEHNLKEKYEIIDAIKELVNSQESLNKTFQDFRDLQDKWRSVGPVPQKKVKDLWEKYHFHVEAFYDYIKINKELRDLDFKKNLKAKIVLCERAEELIVEPSVVEAFRKLQDLHDNWREIGPVPPDKRSEIWERFRDATAKINKRHQEYFVGLKQEQKKNLEEKTVLCEKVEEIVSHELSTAKEWDEKSREIIELQKVWKTIGFAPKKHNTKIYERFRAACDQFFDKKRDYFSQNREEQSNNLQLKTELCIQAESVKDSTDWKKTTEELIALQKKWKEIGPVPSKQSDKIWKRFRSACDEFFNRKSDHFSNIDSKYEGNLKAKEELIEEIKNFALTDDVDVNLNTLKEFQRRWAEIGFVPIKMKDKIQEEYRSIINEKFDKLRIDEDDKAMLKFRSKVDNLAHKPNGDRRLNMEREKCINKLNQLQNDISLWENNIGFFSNSKNAESLIKDVEKKISDAKDKIEQLKEKIRIIDESDDE